MAEITESQVRLARACEESPLLREWLEILTDMPAELRISRITHMASQMERDKEDAALVQAVDSLRDPGFFAGVQAVVFK
ncbi:MAG: hypothetical protein ABI615_11765 [Chthoniobacterales bacterium]